MFSLNDLFLVAIILWLGSASISYGYLRNKERELAQLQKKVAD